MKHLFLLLILLMSCKNTQSSPTNQSKNTNAEPIDTTPVSAFAKKISDAALKLTLDDVSYDPTYFSIKYPNGDVPADKGVCTDVVVRTFRQLDIDLQKVVHEDMQAHSFGYLLKWA